MDGTARELCRLMRDLGLSLVIVGVLACGGRQAATSAMSGDLQSGPCGVDLVCSEGGGHGSLLLPTAVIGAGVLGIAAVMYVYHLVRPPARVTLASPNQAQ